MKHSSHQLLGMLLCVSLWIALPASAQEEETSWEAIYEQMVSMEDADEEQDIDDYDLLQQIADHPIDLNSATREDLEQLPFLSEQQVEDLIAYLDRYGPMRSMGELRMVNSMDHWQIRLLPFFTYIGETTADDNRFPSLKDIAKYGHHELNVALRVPFYERRGDRNGYLGYKYRHWLRYEFTQSQHLRAGLVATQDAGEPFLSEHNRWGYDCYSYYVQLRQLGEVQNLIVGKYKLSTGMGLVFGNSFSLGKLATLQSLGRQARSLRPHASRSEADYFQGAAATVRLTRGLSLTGLLSYRPIDATLNDDGTARTLITNGYHRTQTEIDKKHNTHLTEAGASMSYRYEGLRVGLSAAYAHFDRELCPDQKSLYRRYYLHGNNTTNISADYGYTQRHLSFAGETAIDGSGHVATINSLSLQTSANFSLIALHRFYSYRYTSLHGHSFADGSNTQNESGFYIGANWTPLPHLHLLAYADYAYHPWARYLISHPSHSWDYFVQADWKRGRWNVQGRSRLHLRQRDNEDKTALTDYDDWRSRLFAIYQAPTGWSSKTQVDLSRATFLTTEKGWMVSQHLGYQRNNVQLQLSAGLFDTDGYLSRIYVYEHHLSREFSIPMFSGEGMRLAFTARADLSHHLRLSAKVGYTNYFDRPIIGTGLQQIAHSSMTDLDLQLRWKL